VQTNDDSKQPQAKPAMLLTGATHAREMISTTMVTYQLLKLIQQGYVKKTPQYK